MGCWIQAKFEPKGNREGDRALQVDEQPLGREKEGKDKKAIIMAVLWNYIMFR